MYFLMFVSFKLANIIWECIKKNKNLAIAGWTENAGPVNGGPKKINDMKMQDQIEGHENAGPENAGPQKQDRKMEDKLPKAIT